MPALQCSRCCWRSAAAVRPGHAPGHRRRARGGSGTRRAVQEVGDVACRDGDGEAERSEGERDAAGRRRRRRATDRRRRLATSRPRRRTGHGRHRAVRARHVRREGGEVQPDGTRHDAAGLCAAADEDEVEARRPGEHDQRERTVCGGAVRPGTRHRRRHPHRRRDVCDALRRAVRRGVFVRRPPTATGTARCRSSRRSTTRSAPWPPRTREKACCRPSTRCSTTTATRKAAWSRGARRRTGSRRRSSRSDRCGGRLPPANEKLRALYAERDAHRTADRIAEAAEERHGAREVRGGTGEARDGAGAEVARDSRGRGGQMKAALIGVALAIVTTAAVAGVGSTPQRATGSRAAAGPVGRARRARATRPTTAGSSSCACATTPGSVAVSAGAAAVRRGRTTTRAAKSTSRRS